ncbi:MAG: zinc ribbon domain-containing protein [Clostridia bacterium]|nr:zinc ribbon domain-containing protein [Clostridia bacterium]
MSLINVTCPSCGTALQADDTKEFAFCTECGTKIVLGTPEEEPVSTVETAAGPVPQGGDEAILASLSQALKTEGNFVTNLAGVNECTSQYDRWIYLIGRFKDALGSLQSDVSKETAINEVLAFCDSISKTKISYATGETGKDGNAVTKTYSPDRERANAIKDAKSFFITRFNNLPTRVALSEQLNEELAAANEKVNKLKASVRNTRELAKSSEKEFWTENPEVLNRKRDAKFGALKFLIGGIIVVIIAVVIAAVKKVIWVYGVAVLLLALTIWLANKSSKKAIGKIEQECFPESLKNQKALLESYQKELEAAEIMQKTAQEKLAAFDATRK